MIEIKLKNVDAKPIAGMKVLTSPADSQAHQVWQQFMPRRAEVSGPEDDTFYSLQDYPVDYPWEAYNPMAKFTTWAAKEVQDPKTVPSGFQTSMIKGGLYAVFTHKGSAASIGKSMMYFHSQWLPKSGYMLDKTRKHFEKLGKDYLGPDNPESLEEVFIPILPNTNV